MAQPDVVVIGGGPAGLAAAIVCATSGLATTVVERRGYPIDKACGEGLLPNAVVTLERIGVETTCLAAHGQAIGGIRYLTSQGRTAAAQFPTGAGFGVRRTDLSRALLARAGQLPTLAIVTGQTALVGRDSSGRPVVRAGETMWRPKLVIGADGLHSPTRDAAGITTERRARHRWGCRQHFDGEPWTDHVEVYFARGFEAYVTPVSQGVNVAVLWDDRVVQMPAGPSPVRWLSAQIPGLARRLDGRTPTDRARAGGPFDLRVRQPWRDGVLLLGDAGGYTDPLTGEGVGHALEQAALLAATVVPAVQRLPDDAVVASAVLARYVRQARAQSRPNRQLTRLLLWVARHPVLVERVVVALASSPRLFAHLLDVNMGRRELWQLPAGPDPDSLYAGRESWEQVTQAEAAWAERLARDPRDFESAWKLARARYWLGGHGPESGRKGRLQAGIVASRAAVALEPARPEGHFWMAANMGGLAESFGPIQGLKYRGAVKDALTTVLRLDPAFQARSADRALGRWYHRVPGLAGGSKAKAEVHLRQSLAHAPHSTASLFFLAELLLDQNRDAEARAALQGVLDAPLDPEWAPEDREFKEKARQKLLQLGRQAR